MSTQKWKEENTEKLREYRRNWYYRNKEKQSQYKKARDASLSGWLKQLKSSLVCSQCGESRYACLDFHHRNPSEKEVNLARVLANGWSRERILMEIEKCDVLCSNCHRCLHEEQRLASLA